MHVEAVTVGVVVLDVVVNVVHVVDVEWVVVVCCWGRCCGCW